MVYGSVKNPCGCGTWGHGTVLGSVQFSGLKDFSKLNISPMIPTAGAAAASTWLCLLLGILTGMFQWR